MLQTSCLLEADSRFGCFEWDSFISTVSQPYHTSPHATGTSREQSRLPCFALHKGVWVTCLTLRYSWAVCPIHSITAPEADADRAERHCPLARPLACSPPCKIKPLLGQRTSLCMQPNAMWLAVYNQGERQERLKQIFHAIMYCKVKGKIWPPESSLSKTDHDDNDSKMFLVVFHMVFFFVSVLPLETIANNSPHNYGDRSICVPCFVLQWQWGAPGILWDFCFKLAKCLTMKSLACSSSSLLVPSCWLALKMVTLSPTRTNHWRETCPLYGKHQTNPLETSSFCKYMLVPNQNSCLLG